MSQIGYWTIETKSSMDLLFAFFRGGWNIFSFQFDLDFLIDILKKRIDEEYGQDEERREFYIFGFENVENATF